MRTFFVLSILSAGWDSAPAAAQSNLAAMCVNQCGNACYTKPAGCEIACQQQCMANAAHAGSADTHGAIFIGQPPSGAVGWSYRAANSRDAQGLAQQACEQNNDGKPCRELITYTNKCGVAVKAMVGGAIASVFGSARENAADAQRDAAAQCQARIPQASCEVEAASCSNQG
ncbi:MAG: hypothetical protein U1E45_20285 [Geminicoccaceae bacterium]